MLTVKTKVLAIELSVVVIIGTSVLYLVGLIDLNSFLTVAGFFGYGSVAALRSLFLSGGVKTKIVWIVGSALTAAFGYGNLVGLSWASLEKFGVLLAVVFGVQIVALGHGIAKAGGRSKLS